jgi:L,D-peptidoglycan transpeptidase YkuD (ErfK/YbiS/YcfS/YnhG family)
MRILFLAIWSVLFNNQQTAINEKFNTGQLVVVTTAGWDVIEGSMTVYEWKNNKWSPVLNDIAIVTGRSGLAWGKGLHDDDLNKGQMKKEGDGNSPAGIFYLSGLFGYQDHTAKMDYLKVDDRTFCVDDIKSAYYNHIVKADTVKKDWDSAETMRMKSDVYKYGIFVDYNTDPVVAGDGSCIFMHIWRRSDSPTAGCTAMTEDNMLKLMAFLDKSKNPVLVQVPRSEYAEMKKRYNLPSI